MSAQRLIALTTVVVANPIAHVVRAVDGVPYAAWHPINVLVVASLLGLGLAWAAFLRREDLRVSYLPVWPLLLVAVVACVTAPGLRSLLWGLHLGAASAFGVVVAKRIDSETLRRGVVDGLVVLLLTSLVLVFAWPRYGVVVSAINDGAWRGVFAGKNHLGLVAAMAVVLARGNVLALLLGAVTLWGTRSGTGMLVAIVGVGVRRPYVLAALGVLFVATLLMRDVSMSGRTALWRHVSEKIAEKPLVGHGLRAYFEDVRDERVLQAEMNAATAKGRVLSQVKEPAWRIHHAHNGFLQTALDLGVLVTLLLLAWLLRCEHVVLVMLLAHNLTEVSLLRTWHPEALLWHLAVYSRCVSRS